MNNYQKKSALSNKCSIETTDSKTEKNILMKFTKPPAMRACVV